MFSLLLIINSAAVQSKQETECCEPGKCYIIIGKTQGEYGDSRSLVQFDAAVLAAIKDCQQTGLETVLLDYATKADVQKAIQDKCAKEMIIFAHGPGKTNPGDEARNGFVVERGELGAGDSVYGDDVQKWLNESFGNGSVQAKHPCLKKAIMHVCGSTNEWADILGVDKDRFFGWSGSTNPLFIMWWQIGHSQKPGEIDMHKIPGNNKQACRIINEPEEIDNALKTTFEPLIKALNDGKTRIYAATDYQKFFLLGVNKENGKLANIYYNEDGKADSSISISSPYLYELMESYTDSGSAAMEKTGCPVYDSPDCNGACQRNRKCEQEPGKPGCYFCSPTCANDEFYNDENCAGQCTEGFNKCAKSGDTPCYRCKPLEEKEASAAEPEKGLFARLFSSLFKPKEDRKLDYEAETYAEPQSEDCKCGAQDLGNHRICYRKFNDEAKKEGYRTPVVCECSGDACECSYCKEKRNREKKKVYVVETGDNTGIFTAETAPNTGIFGTFRSLFRNLFKTERTEKIILTIEEKESEDDARKAAENSRCPGGYEDENCHNYCQRNSMCEADQNNQGCYYCAPVCSNDEFYKDSDCGKLCVEGVNKCTQSEQNSDCYWCKPTCRRGEFYKDANCAGLCFKGEQQCALTNSEGECYSCQPVQKKAMFVVDRVNVSQNYVLIAGIVSDASRIKYLRVNDLFKGKTESYPAAFNQDKTRFTFMEKLELGKHVLTVEADLANDERVRSEPVIANVEKEKCTGHNIYSDPDCLNACYRNAKCVAREDVPGCYGCEAVCGAGEFYNDASCGGQCTKGFNECSPSTAADCYWCKPVESSSFYFEFKDTSQDWKQVSSMVYGHKIHFIVASKATDVRLQLPITITLALSGEERFKAKIPNEPALYCRGADGCSIDGPLIEGSWENSPISVKAYGKDSSLLVEYRQ